ncbi:MAG: hypothetical protein V1745_04570 [Patescibacteria group bacterium]
MEEYRTLRSYFEQDGDLNALKLIEGKTPKEIVETMESVFKDAARDCGGMKDFTRFRIQYVCAIRDYIRSEASDSQERDDPDLGTREESRRMMSCWSDTLTSVPGRPSFLARSPAAMAEVLDSVAYRWSVTSDDDEAERLMCFILGVADVTDGNDEMFVIWRHHTGKSVSMRRLLQAYRTLRQALEGRSFSWSPWVRYVHRTLAIALVRKSSFEQTDAMFDALSDTLVEREMHANGESIAY